MMHEFKPAEFRATCCGGPRNRTFIAKTGMSHEENCRCNMSPLHVPATCPLVCAGLYFAAVRDGRAPKASWSMAVLGFTIDFTLRLISF